MLPQSARHANSGSSSDPFGLSRWAVSTEEQRRAVDSMLGENKWVPNPLPAYHLTGNILLPAMYRPLLPGATVVLTICITRRVNTMDRVCDFSADVTELDFLQMGPRLDVGPRERDVEQEIRKCMTERKRRRRL